MAATNSVLKRMLQFIIYPFTYKRTTTHKDTFQTPNNSLEDIRLIPAVTQNSFLNDSILIEKQKYEEMLEKIKALEIMKSEYELKEEEYIKLLHNVDVTLSLYDNDNTGEKNGLITKLTDELERMDKNEKRMKEYIENLQKELIDSEEKNNMYKIFAHEMKESLTSENEKLKKMVEKEIEEKNKINERVHELENEIMEFSTIVESLDVHGMGSDDGK